MKARKLFLIRKSKPAPLRAVCQVPQAADEYRDHGMLPRTPGGRAVTIIPILQIRKPSPGERRPRSPAAILWGCVVAAPFHRKYKTQ